MLGPPLFALLAGAHRRLSRRASCALAASSAAAAVCAAARRERDRVIWKCVSTIGKLLQRPHAVRRRARVADQYALGTALESAVREEASHGHAIPDLDPQETREWLDALDGVLAVEGPDRAHFLIEQLIDKARRSGAYLPFSANTAYINTIPVEQQVRIPGRPGHRATHPLATCAGTRWRWCCARTSTPTSAATSRASRRRRRSTTSASTTSGTRRRTTHGGDLVFFQGHSAHRRLRARVHARPADRRSSSTTSGRRSTARASRRIRIRG